MSVFIVKKVIRPRKIYHATPAEIIKLRQEYAEVAACAHTVNSGLFLIGILVAIPLVIYFSNIAVNLAGLGIFAVSLCAFAFRRGHRTGYMEGYYEAVSKYSRPPAIQDIS